MIQEYKAEGIELSHVEYVDNRPILDMFLAKPLGILALLDEESRFPGASSASLIGSFLFPFSLFASSISIPISMVNPSGSIVPISAFLFSSDLTDSPGKFGTTSFRAWI